MGKIRYSKFIWDVARDAGIKPGAAKAVINSICRVVALDLTKNKPVRLAAGQTALGTLYMKRRSPRSAYTVVSPLTGQANLVSAKPAKFFPRFKPSEQLKRVLWK